jgi:hypothetical protein
MLNFDAFLTNFTSICFFLVLLFCLLFLRSALSQKSFGKIPFWVWGVVFFAVLALMRYPFLAYNQELEVDESQMLAQAISLKKYWVYWKYVDGLTQGPLTIFFLTIPSWLGMPFDYATTRLLGFVVLSATLVLTYLTFNNFFKRKVSLIIFAPIGLFYVLSQGYFSAVCNEYLVLLVLAFCFWLSSVIYTQPNPSGSTLFILGLVSGMIPFAKLQGVPTALMIVLFTFILILLRSRHKIRDVAVLGFGGICFPLLVFALVIQFGAFEYFWKFYIIGNIEYSGGGTMLSKLLAFPDFLRHSGQLIFLLLSFFILAVYSLIVLVRSQSLGNIFSLLFYFGVIHIFMAFYSIIKPGYYFQHYLQFLIIPIGLFTGVLVEAALAQTRWNSKNVWSYSLTWLAICMVPHTLYKVATITGRASRDNKHISIGDLGKPMIISPVSQEIKKYLRPEDDITIWGWKPAYHVETGAAQGTADVMIYRLMTPAPKQQDYIQKYLDDMERSKPVVFVDEVTDHSFWFGNPAQWGHENFPGIRSFVSKYYSQVATINGERIFVRKDRLAGMTDTGAKLIQ